MTQKAQINSSPLSSTTHPLLLTEMSSASAVSATSSFPTTPVVFRIPQLAIRTQPMLEYSEDSVSEVNYEEPQDQTPIPPAGFITNDPTHPFFYCYITVGTFTWHGLSHYTKTLGSRVLVSSTKSEEDLESFWWQVVTA